MAPKSTSKSKPNARAEQQLAHYFPHGFQIIPTDSGGLLCGLNAIINSIRANQLLLTAPLLPQLHTIDYFFIGVEKNH